MRIRPITLTVMFVSLSFVGAVAAVAQDPSAAAEGSVAPQASPGADQSVAPEASMAPDASMAPEASMAPAAGAEASPGMDVTGDLPHPAHIHAGSCPEPGDVVAPLSDVMQPTVEMVGAGADQVPLELSTSFVDMALSDILAGEHAVNVHESADAADVYIACGNIGSQLTGEDSVAIVLEEQNGSGHTGFAWLTDQGDGTTRVDIILTRALDAGASGGTAAGSSPMPAMSPAASAVPQSSQAPSPAASPGAG